MNNAATEHINRALTKGIHHLLTTIRHLVNKLEIPLYITNINISVNIKNEKQVHESSKENNF